MTDDELETLTEAQIRIAVEPNDRSVIVQEVASPHGDDERVYVVRVPRDASKYWTLSCLDGALQRHPGMPSNYHENDEPENRIGAPCPNCECGGMLTTVTFPLAQIETEGSHHDR